MNSHFHHLRSVQHHVRTSAFGDGGEGNKCVWCKCRRSFHQTFAIHCEKASELFSNVMQSNPVHAKSTSWCLTSAMPPVSVSRTPQNCERPTKNNREKLHHKFIAKFIDELRELHCAVLLKIH